MSASAVFSCFTCGYGDNTNNDGDQRTGNDLVATTSWTPAHAPGNNCDRSSMRRVSTSRRSSANQYPPSIRARSSERAHYSDKSDNDNDETNTFRGNTLDEDFKDSMTFEDSERTDRPRGGSFHRRAMSDPYDAQENEKDSDEDGLANDLNEFLEAQSATHLPTLARYPVAETRNQNCWSEPPVDIFSVRGPDYFASKKKIQSGPYLLQARGCDLFLNNKEDSSVRLESKSDIILGGRLHSTPTILVNFRFPWGYMVLYFEVPAKLAPYLKREKGKVDTALSTAEQTLARWLLGDTNYKNERLKLIPYVAQGPWVVRNMVTGRPAIIGKKLPVTYRIEQNALFCTLDIGSSSATAKRIVSVCRRYMSALTVDIGFVIQGETPLELPEQMMGSVRIHGVDPLKAPRV
jgi:hypothetical protein